MGRNSKHWRKYISLCHSQGYEPGSRFAKFNARYRLAKSFEGLKAPGLTGRNLIIYDAVMKVALAYSALEALEKAVFERIHRDRSKGKVVSRSTLDSLRRGDFEKLCQLIVETEDNSDRKARFLKRLSKCIDGQEGEDVRVFAEGIRNVVFHGLFTAKASGLSTKETGLLELFAADILDSADRAFEVWLQSQSSQQATLTI